MNHKRRRGVSIVLVLALVTITLAVSYAVLRTQSIDDQIQLNYDRRSAARHAALTGLNLGLRQISQPDWEGVGVDLNGNLDDQSSYLVQYFTGDPQLSSGDPDYHLYPYRVTITSTGRAVAPGDAAVVSEHTSQAVVELILRKLVDPPAAWTAARDYSIYQWGDTGSDSAEFEMPCHVSGPVRLQTELRLAEAYPYDGDDKPFAGRIDEVAVFGVPLSESTLDDIAAGDLGLDALVADSSMDAVAWWRLDESDGATLAVDQLGLHHGRYVGARAGHGAVPDVGGSAAAAFDGFNDQIFVESIDVPGLGMTITAWIRADNFNVADGRIISKSAGSSEDQHYWMLSTVQVGDVYRLRFRMKTLGGSTKTLIADSGDLPTGSWIFVAAVFDGMEMRLYKDGNEVGSRSLLGLNAVNAAVPASIGNNPPGSSRAHYLQDLQAEYEETGNDYRPLTGPIEAPRSKTSAETWSLVETDLDVAVTDRAADGLRPAPHPGDISSYQLYPGGEFYTVPALNSLVEQTTLGPDPLTNPLGVFKRDGELWLGDNTVIQGTVLVSETGFTGDLKLIGQNVSLTPVNLPPLYGDSATYQLPVAIVGDDFKLLDGSASVTGKVVAGDDFEYSDGSATNACTQRGGVVAREIQLLKRSQWDQSASWWDAQMLDHLRQLDSVNAINRFPEWLESNHQLIRAPLLTIAPDTSSVTYHWHDWSQPLFQPHPNDGGGLRWNVVSLK